MRLEDNVQKCKASAVICNYYEKEFKYNEKTNSLELISEKGINIFEKVQSNKDCALDKILDKFINQGIVPQASISTRTNIMTSKIDAAMEKSLFVEEIKQKYKLPIYYTEKEVFEFLEKAQNISKQKVKDLQDLQDNKIEKDNNEETSKKDNVSSEKEE